MKAVAVTPGKPESAHLVEIPKPDLNSVANGRGVLVKVLQIGVDGTDKEIYLSHYGRAPEGQDFLVTGHEAFGVVEAVGPDVWEFKPGDFVVPTVRRAGHSLYDQIGYADMTTDEVYYERGINLLNGFMTEYFVDSADYLVTIPVGLSDVAVLLEPLTIAIKGVTQAYEIQRRLHLWRPKRAMVAGAGPLGMLAALTLRLRGLEVDVYGLTPQPNLPAQMLEELGCRYLVSTESPVVETALKQGRYDIMFEATGFSPMVFDCMQALANDGVLILASVTGGNRTATVPADVINKEFVLGNKVMVGTVNAAREYFVQGVSDMALSNVTFPGWLQRFMTHPVDGLENFKSLYANLMAPPADGVLKTYFNVAKVPARKHETVKVGAS